MNPPEGELASDQAAVDSRQIFADGLMSLLKPVVIELDGKIAATRSSQICLRNHIDSLAEDLRQISEEYPAPYDLEAYVKKLQESKKRIAVVGSILQNAQDRLAKLQHQVAKETAKRKAQLDAAAPNSSPP